MISQSELIKEARMVVSKANQEKIILRLLGGVGIELACKKVLFIRSYEDIDLIGFRNQTHLIGNLLSGLGYFPRKRFNMVHGASRMIFDNPISEVRIDVFLEPFEMCHKIDLKKRLTMNEETLSKSDLLATKLQIVEMTEKDFLDILNLLFSSNIVSEDISNKISLLRLNELCSKDWGICQTFLRSTSTVQSHIENYVTDAVEQTLLKEKLESIRISIIKSRKSINWKLRSLLGTKKRWYQVPDQESD